MGVLLTESRSKNHENKINNLDQNENVEQGIITFADAIVYPGTMMIESIDTPVTKIAVTAPWCSYKPTLRA